VVGRRFPACGRPVLGVRCVGFGWEKWMTVHGGGGGGGRAMGRNRWSSLTGDAWRTEVMPNAGHWLLVRGRERVRASELEREKGLGVFLGPSDPTCPPSLVHFSFLFFVSINNIQLNSGPVLANG